MKIAIIGSKGFVGSSLYKHFESNHTVCGITRDVINVLDPYQVKDFLKQNLFDVVINCAAVMTDSNLLFDARNNLGMFMNFYDNKNLYGKFINTASGAEYDRETNIDNANEDLIFQRMPKDSYGWGQNMKSRICAQTEHFYNIRIFNCFGPGEIPTRIFPRFLNNNENFIITNDRYFDYFTVQDLCNVVENCVDVDWKVNDVNAVYKTKYRISEVLDKFCKFKNLNSDFKIESTSENNYTGSSDRLMSLKINLSGLDEGLKNY